MKIKTGYVRVDRRGKVHRSPEVSREVPDTWLSDAVKALREIKVPPIIRKDGKEYYAVIGPGQIKR